MTSCRSGTTRTRAVRRQAPAYETLVFTLEVDRSESTSFSHHTWAVRLEPHSLGSKDTGMMKTATSRRSHVLQPSILRLLHVPGRTRSAKLAYFLPECGASSSEYGNRCCALARQQHPKKASSESQAASALRQHRNISNIRWAVCCGCQILERHGSKQAESLALGVLSPTT